MALSNLILKLSINMSRLSIFVVTKLLLPPYLNIFITSVAFEKYMEKELLIKSQNLKGDDLNYYIKLFPKICIVKVGVNQNACDSHIINKCQDMFSKETQSIQLIDLFREKDPAIKEESKSKRIESFDLKSAFGLKSPYGMELYLLFSEIIIEKMADFKPDIVIFIE